MNRINCRDRKYIPLKWSENKNALMPKNNEEETVNMEELRPSVKKQELPVEQDLQDSFIGSSDQEQIMKLMHPQLKVNYVRCSNLPEEYRKDSIIDKMKKKAERKTEVAETAKRDAREVVLKDMGSLDDE